MSSASIKGKWPVGDGEATAGGGIAKVALDRGTRALDFESHVGSNQKRCSDKRHQQRSGGSTKGGLTGGEHWEEVILAHLRFTYCITNIIVPFVTDVDVCCKFVSGTDAIEDMGGQS